MLGLGGDPRDRPFVADWDGDCSADLGIFRDGDWYVLTSPLGNPAVRTFQYGAAGDTPIADRLDRNLASTKYRQVSTHAGLYRPADGTFLFRMTPVPNPDLILHPGVATRAIAADFEGAGTSSLVLYQDGIWLVDHKMDGTADEVFYFGGAPQDIPLVGDVDGDGHADLVIYRDGAWFVSTTRDGNVAFTNYFGGVPGDVPVLGDVDGDGRADFGIYRDGLWYFDTNGDGVPDLVYGFGGAPGDVPLVADWNGDGRPDLIIYRAGIWYVSTLSEPGVPYAQDAFGAASDVPVAGNFVVATSAAPVLFAPQARPIGPLGGGLLPPAAADYDGDGRDEPLGGRNDGAGAIVGVDLTAAGLASLFSPGRVNRDCRAADFNGDGRIDLVCNTYSDIGNAASFARLYLGDGAGGFVEDPAFAALDIRGFGETILAADFNNDGAIDLFFPYYSQNDAAEHSYLLVNDGSGHFTDIADTAGVALRGVPANHRVEGAQAVDFDGDGWIDFYVAGRLFRNNGDLTFTDVTDAVGLPGSFDEGIKFLDWNNDGFLDLIIHHPTYGPALWEFDGTRFTQRDVMPQYLNSDVYGVNVADFNGDGREDVIVAGGPGGRVVRAAQHRDAIRTQSAHAVRRHCVRPGLGVRLRPRRRDRPRDDARRPPRHRRTQHLARHQPSDADHRRRRRDRAPQPVRPRHPHPARRRAGRHDDARGRRRLRHARADAVSADRADPVRRHASGRRAIRDGIGELRDAARRTDPGLRGRAHRDVLMRPRLRRMPSFQRHNGGARGRSIVRGIPH